MQELDRNEWEHEWQGDQETDTSADEDAAWPSTTKRNSGNAPRDQEDRDRRRCVIALARDSEEEQQCESACDGERTPAFVPPEGSDARDGEQQRDNAGQD